MSENETESMEGAALPSAGDDPRKAWIPPTIEEIPVKASEGGVAGTPSADLGTYS